MTGKELKAMRRAAGFTQRDLAKKTGLTPGDICMFETTRRSLSLVHPVKNQQLEEFFKKEGLM